MEKIISKNIPLEHDRKGSVKISNTICSITNEKCLCVVVDGSEGEYGEIAISIEYLKESQRQIIEEKE